jgi:phage/plasmid-associated DNA primase
MYKYQYKCTSIKHGVWYEFKNHQWFQIDNGLSLRRKIGNEVVNEYMRLITYYNTTAFEQQDEKKDQYLQTSKNLTSLTYKLRDDNFKEKIMKECQTMFYDGQFESNLDTNPDLIGFENGVYDLRNAEFRDGRPEDCISLTTGNDFIEFNEDDELIITIYNFLSQIFPDRDVRDYVLILLASFLEGRNPNEKFHIWTGVGNNGQSQLLELFELAFGKYTAKIPVTVLTQKTRGSSNANNPEVARLKDKRTVSAQEPEENKRFNVGLMKEWTRGSSNANNPEVSRLKGKRTVSTQEPEENKRFNVGLMKEWTGGDRLTCHPPDKDPFDFKPQFKMVFCCHHLPSLPSDDEGTWRRVSVTEFKRDPYLTEKLYTLKEAFMYILLEHYKIYKKHGLIEPIAVKDATHEYRKHSRNNRTNSNLDEKIANDKGHVYLLIKKEFIDDRLSIYKIGRTNQKPAWKQLQQYPEGSVPILLIAVNDSKLVKKSIKEKLKDTDGIKHRLDLGQEYFEGNVSVISGIFLDNCQNKIVTFS